MIVKERIDYLDKLKAQYRVAMMQVTSVRIELASNPWDTELKASFEKQITGLEWSATEIYKRLEMMSRYPNENV